MDGADKRWDEIRTIWKQYQGLYLVVGFIGGLFTYPLLTLVITDLLELLQNLVPEGLGITFTVLFIDTLYRRRETERQRHERIERLLHEVRSKSNERAKAAVDDLRHDKLLVGSNGLLKERFIGFASLAGANLIDANLEGTDLSGADLQGAWLSGANLQNGILAQTKLIQARLLQANLRYANLHKAVLKGAELRGTKLQETNLEDTNMAEADLTQANLQKAKLRRANLKGAYLFITYLAGTDLREANLQDAFLAGANLVGADLRNANLKNVVFDYTFDQDGKRYIATMPNGEKWQPDTDLERFTNPDHLKFFDVGAKGIS